MIHQITLKITFQNSESYGSRIPLYLDGIVVFSLGTRAWQGCRVEHTTREKNNKKHFSCSPRVCRAQVWVVSTFKGYNDGQLSKDASNFLRNCLKTNFNKDKGRLSAQTYLNPVKKLWMKFIKWVCMCTREDLNSNMKELEAFATDKWYNIIRGVILPITECPDLLIKQRYYN